MKNDLKNESIAQRIARELEVFRVIDDTLYRYRNYGFSNMESKLEPIRVIEIKKGEYRPIKFGSNGTYSIIDIKHVENSDPIPAEESLIASIMVSDEDLIDYENELLESQKKLLKEYKFIDKEINQKIKY